MTPHQTEALLYIYDKSDAWDGKNRKVGINRGEVGQRTAFRLEEMGLIETSAMSGGRLARIGGFTGHIGYRRVASTEVVAHLTPLGKEVAEAILAEQA